MDTQPSLEQQLPESPYEFLSPDELFAEELPDVEPVPDAVTLPLSFDVPPANVSIPVAPSFVSDEGWSWHDGALIAVERTHADGETTYEIGAVDLYANVHTGDLGGSYLPIGSFGEIDQAAAYYHHLQGEIEERMLLPFQLMDFAGEQARERAVERGEPVPTWTACSPAEFSAYDAIRSLNNLEEPELWRGEPSSAGAIQREPEPAGRQTPSFKALREIGIEADGFDPDSDPPPFVDPQTGTAYWIGIFQPDKDDRENCITSILSLGRDPNTGEMQAQLAPCVPGNWDKAYGAAEYLLGVVEKGGIDRCLDAAEGMALAAEQRELWDAAGGIPLESDAARELAAYTQDRWEIEL